MKKYWYTCGQSADDGYEVPMELTESEADFVSKFIKALEDKNKVAEYCGSTFIKLHCKYDTEEECWDAIKKSEMESW